MSRLARQHRIFYLPLPVSIWRTLSYASWRSNDGPSIVSRLIRPVFSPLESLWVVTLKRWLPGRLEGISLFAIVNREIIRLQIRSLLKKFLIKTPVVWVQNVGAAEYLDLFNDSILVYDNTEDWMEFFSPARTNYLRSVAEWDKLLMRKAQLVITVSEYLYHKKLPFNTNTYLVQNGCDYEHFNKADAPGTLVADELRNIQHPIIGYVGWLSTRFDFNLVEKLAMARPDWNIVLIGPLQRQEDADRLRPYANVRLTGAVPYQDLPAYIKAFDVCIIPHLVNPLTDSMNPLKLFEYLATGRPIVTTRVGGVDQFSGLIYIADDFNQFIQMTEKAIKEEAPKKKLKRLKEARLHTWDKIVDDVEKLIDKAQEKTNGT